MFGGMDLFMLTGAFLFAFVMICMALWGMYEFYKHDYRASWWAYLAVAMPMFFLIANGVIGLSQPHHDAQLLPQDAEQQVTH